jgi:hypothetical protein
MFKLVDQSHNLGQLNVDTISTKEELFAVMKKYLDRLFANATEDSKMFWMTYTKFIVNENGLYFTSNLDTQYPIYDVDVKKSDEMNITVIPYKIDGMKEYKLTKFKLYETEVHVIKKVCGCYRFLISPLELYGIEQNLETKYEGTIYLRSDFTEWNQVGAEIDIYAIEF